MVEKLEKGEATPRPVHSWDVPDGIDGDIRTFGLYELSAREEMDASKRARTDPVKLAYELARQALAEVNGTPVSLADGSADRAWASMNAKVRQLVLFAYSELHTVEEEAAQAFRKSRKVKV